MLYHTSEPIMKFACTSWELGPNNSEKNSKDLEMLQERDTRVVNGDYRIISTQLINVLEWVI